MITDQSYYLIDVSKLTPNPTTITITVSGKEARGWIGGGVWLVQFNCTNQLNRSWISADRSTKLLSCLQYFVQYKSSTKDLTRPTYEITIQHEAIIWCWPEGYRNTRHIGRGETSSLSSKDSDLEAFSHNPADDSFAALATQPTALPNIRTNGSSRTKLDYCRDNQLISRVKLTCLTTV